MRGLYWCRDFINPFYVRGFMNWEWFSIGCLCAVIVFLLVTVDFVWHELKKAKKNLIADIVRVHKIHLEEVITLNKQYDDLDSRLRKYSLEYNQRSIDSHNTWNSTIQRVVRLENNVSGVNKLAERLNIVEAMCKDTKNNYLSCIEHVKNLNEMLVPRIKPKKKSR